VPRIAAYRYQHCQELARGIAHERLGTALPPHKLDNILTFMLFLLLPGINPNSSCRR
jgi:hypothetical protein